jgi:hypothetical protein
VGFTNWLGAREKAIEKGDIFFQEDILESGPYMGGVMELFIVNYLTKGQNCRQANDGPFSL